MTHRVVVTVKAADVRKGDRFAGGVVARKDAHVRDGHALIAISRKGVKAGTLGLTRFPADQQIKVLRPDTYIRYEARNRETGTVVQVLDLDDPGTEFDRGHYIGLDGENVADNRWATTCVDHSIIVTHATLALAMSHATAPSGWCEGCRNVEAGCACERPGDDMHDDTPTCPLNPATTGA